MGPRMPRDRVAERMLGITGSCLLVMGVALVGVYAVARIHRVAMSQMALHQFLQAERQKPTSSMALVTPEDPAHGIDFGRWSIGRITAFGKNLSKQFASPQAVLEIPRIGLEIPVFDGTDGLTLNRGVGRIVGTARLGQGGNLGIAGHRDGFFRGLKDVVVGDRIKLETPGREETYEVEQIQIVKPTDVQVLEDHSVPTLTLVTCYPFYLVGNAPLRYIVRASLWHEKPGSEGKGSGQFNTRKSQE